MIRLSLLILLSLPTLCFGQNEAAVKLTENQIKKIAIYPALTTTPALQHRLYPNRKQLIDRNAATYYHRAIFKSASISSSIYSQNLLASEDQQLATLSNNYDQWLNSPISEMPLDEMRAWVDRYSGVFDDMIRARNSAHCDWGILPDAGEDIAPFSIMMEEIQQLRAIARLLAVATRIAIFEKDYDTAIQHLQMGYKIAHDASQNKTLVASLVSISCALIMKEQQLSLMQQPDAPNLYWALVDLPDPIGQVRAAFRTELSWLSGPNCMWQSLRSPETLDLTADGWRELFLKDFRNFGKLNQGNDSMESSIVLAMALRGYPIAKQSLAATGYSAAEIEAMPVLQAIAIHEARANASICQDAEKILNLPYRDMKPYLNQLEKRLDSFLMNSTDETSIVDSNLLPYLGTVMPAMPQVIDAEIRSSRNLAALKVIEAIRMHVAKTQKLPGELSEITGVPLPLNPATGMPFDYELANGIAIIKDYSLARHNWRRYEISIAR